MCCETVSRCRAQNHAVEVPMSGSKKWIKNKKKTGKKAKKKGGGAASMKGGAPVKKANVVANSVPNNSAAAVAVSSPPSAAVDSADRRDSRDNKPAASPDSSVFHFPERGHLVS